MKSSNIIASCSSKPKKRSKQNNSYIKTSILASQEQHEYLKELCQEAPNENTFRFFAHIMDSAIHRVRVKEDPYVPIPFKTIKTYLPGADWQWLFDEELILDKTPEFTQGKSGNGQCRRYKPLNSIITRYLEIGYQSIVRSGRKLKKVDLLTGKLSQKKERTKLNDGNRHRYPKLWCDAIDHIRDTEFDDDCVRLHIIKLKQEYEEAEQEYNEAKRSEGDYLREVCKKRLDKARGRYWNDLACYFSIQSQHPVTVDEGKTSFKAAYRPASTGRSQVIGGGLQSCTRAMKQAAYGRMIEAGALKNYDIKSSQINIVINFMEEAGLKADCLKMYVSNPKAKQEYSELTELDIDTWKKCFLALIMGAGKPSVRTNQKNSISTYLEEYTLLHGKDLSQVVDGFNNVTKGLRKELKAWHDYLVRHIGQVRDSYVRNSMGFTLQLTELNSLTKQEKIRKLTAFYLQGKEAEFIAHITILSDKYGYEVIQNEHDGLIVRGEIPEEAKQEAKELAKIDLELVEKPLC